MGEAQLDFMSDKREDFEGSSHLLILADSAELLLESKGQKLVSSDICEMRTEVTRSQCHGKAPRLSQVPHQTQSGSNQVVVLGEAKRTRLNQIKRLARSEGHFKLQQNDFCTDKAQTKSECLLRQAGEEVADRQLDRKTSKEIFEEGEGSQQDGDCSHQKSDARKEAAQHVSGKSDKNTISTRRRSKRISRLRSEAQHNKGRNAYTPSEFLLAMLRRC